MSSKATISQLRKCTRKGYCQAVVFGVRFPGGAGRASDWVARAFLEVRSFHLTLRERAEFRDALGGTLHGVTCEAAGAAGGAPCQWSERHSFDSRIKVGGAILATEALASTDGLVLFGQDDETAMRYGPGVFESHRFFATATHREAERGRVVGVDR
jgi:hypothetical protein